jgi:hypothetical protein
MERRNRGQPTIMETKDIFNAPTPSYIFEDVEKWKESIKLGRRYRGSNPELLKFVEEVAKEKNKISITI